jgi:hypothetical protein
VLEVTLNRLTGYRRSPRGRQRRPIIRSTGTLRIRQVDGLNLSTVIATSPLRTVAIAPRTDFHKVSRAAGPKRQVGTTRSVDAIKRERSIALPQDANAMEVADLLRQHIFAAVLGNDAASCCQKLR